MAADQMSHVDPKASLAELDVHANETNYKLTEQYAKRLNLLDSWSAIPQWNAKD